MTAGEHEFLGGVPRASCAARRASARRGSSTRTQGTDRGLPAGAGRSDTTAAAPRAIASRHVSRSRPPFRPRMATKRSPGTTCRESLTHAQDVRIGCRAIDVGLRQDRQELHELHGAGGGGAVSSRLRAGRLIGGGGFGEKVQCLTLARPDRRSRARVPARRRNRCPATAPTVPGARRPPAPAAPRGRRIRRQDVRLRRRYADPALRRRRDRAAGRVSARRGRGANARRPARRPPG